MDRLNLFYRFNSADCAISCTERKHRIRIVKQGELRYFLGNDCRRDESTNSLTFLRGATWTREPSDSLRDYSTRSCFPFSASQFCKIYICVCIYIYIYTRDDSLSRVQRANFSLASLVQLFFVRACSWNFVSVSCANFYKLKFIGLSFHYQLHRSTVYRAKYIVGNYYHF